MTKARRTFNAPFPPQRIWDVVSDLDNWADLLVLDKAKSKGWGDRLAADGEPGMGTRIKMLHGDKLMQTWEIDAWSAPAHLKLSSRRFHGVFFLSMRSTMDVAVSAAAPGQSTVDLELATEFSFPLVRLLLNAYVPLGPDVELALERMEAAILGLSAG